MSKKISINAASRLINGGNKIVVFWDTCSLLDIIRLPYSTKPFNQNDLILYQRICELVENDTIISISSAIIINELSNNLNKVEKDYDDGVKRIQDGIKRYDDFLNVCTPPIAQFSISLSSKPLKEQLRSIYDRILDKTLLINEKAEFMKFAHFRVSNKMAPAEKKGEYKDCYIWGTCIKLSERIYRRQKDLLFITSNPEDYYNAETRSLYQLIQSDCQINSIKFSLFIGALYGEIRTIEEANINVV
jgi:hypothetical protein